MKAIRIVPGPAGGRLEIQDIPRPEAGSGQLLVRVAASGLNRGEVNQVKRAMAGSPLTTGVEFAHAVGHRALAAKDDAFGGGHHGRVGRNDDIFAARHVLQRLRHRAQVTHAVVDDGNAHNEPLVDGMVPAMRGSGVAAMRSARPKALKTVSA